MVVETDGFRLGAGTVIAVAPWDVFASDVFWVADDSATGGSVGALVVTDGSAAGAGGSGTEAVAVSVAMG